MGHTSASPITMAPTITFTAKNQNGDLVIRIVSCTDLPEKDFMNVWGYGNHTDAYVIVDMGGTKRKTQTVGGTINPAFEEISSTFQFNGKGSGGLVTFKIMDHDTLTADDDVGTARIDLTADRLGGGLITL